MYKKTNKYKPYPQILLTRSKTYTCNLQNGGINMQYEVQKVLIKKTII